MRGPYQKVYSLLQIYNLTDAEGAKLSEPFCATFYLTNTKAIAHFNNVKMAIIIKHLLNPGNTFTASNSAENFFN